MADQIKYIDADDFRGRMYEEAFEKDNPMQKWDSGCWIRYKLFENMIEAQPPADVVPVVRGEWVPDKYDPEFKLWCSVCDWTAEYPYNFCPNCGAAMNEEALRIIAERNKWRDAEGEDDEEV